MISALPAPPESSLPRLPDFTFSVTSAVPEGGDQQLASSISCNEVDLLIFFRDPLNAKSHEPNDINILRLCDVHNIPVATNIATAEALIHALERGDLDWREYMRN